MNIVSKKAASDLIAAAVVSMLPLAILTGTVAICPRSGSRLHLAGWLMSTLDELLYTWLAEPPGKHFELAYARYFTVAFPAIVRYLSRRTNWDPADLQDLAQKSMIKFYEHVGTRRMIAATELNAALPRLQPLNYGPFHRRQVLAWKVDVTAFRDTAAAWIAAAARNSVEHRDMKSLNGRISPLQHTGCLLLTEVRSHVAAPGMGASQGAMSGDSTEDTILAFGVALLANDADAEHQELTTPDVIPFVGAVVTIVTKLPCMRLHSSGLLFGNERSIAWRTYLDAHRGRKDGEEPIETDREVEPESVEEAEDSRHIDEIIAERDYFEKFLAYLSGDFGARAPDRLLAVLERFAEGLTQEEIATALSITRDQVRYALEQVKDAYLRFERKSGSAAIQRASPISQGAQS